MISKWISLLTLLMIVLLVPMQAVADTPSTLQYQGYLTSNTGQAISGTKKITLRLYSVPSGGTPFWSEVQQNVVVNNGRFSAVLGANTSNPINPAQFTGETYIGVTVDSDAEMAPRQKFTSVAYAFNALNVVNLPNIPDPIPSGIIVMWKGAVNQIPPGWALCDGTNGTPDLRDRFVIGAGNRYSVAASGGSTTKDLSHIHTGPSHNHTYSGNTSGDIATGTHRGGELSDKVEQHYHNYSGTTSNNGTGNTGSTGSATQDIMPPYYALAFIMKR